MKKIAKVLSLLLTFMLLLTSCGNKDNDTNKVNVKEEQKKETVITLEGGNWGYPNPYTHYSRGPGMFKMRLIFDSLLERGENGYIPWLAEKWEISKDGKEYKFKIRENVKWQDGEPMTAEDIKFSFEYFAEHPPVTDDLAIGKNNYIDKIEVLDKYNIKIIVKKPNSTLLERFGTARIIPEHIWKDVKDPKKFTDPKSVIGCGPYKLTDYNEEQGAYKFDAFKEYWGPKQKVDVLKFVPVSDSLLSFENSEIDLTSVTPDALQKYKDNPKYKIIENPGFWGYKLALNMEKRPELKDKNLRQALAYGINKDALIEKVARGAAKVASAGYLPVQHTWYNKDVKKYDFNMNKAKKLINNKTYNFTLLTGNSKAELRIAELIKIDLANFGINLEVKSVDSKSRDAAIKKGDYEIALNGYGGWGGDADLLRAQYSSIPSKKNMFSGIPGYCNENINKLCEQQLSEIDTNKRKEIIFKLQEEIAEEVPQIPLYNTTGYNVFMPEKYDGWKHVFNHHELTHNKISYLDVK